MYWTPLPVGLPTQIAISSQSYLRVLHWTTSRKGPTFSLRPFFHLRMCAICTAIREYSAAKMSMLPNSPLCLLPSHHLLYLSVILFCHLSSLCTVFACVSSSTVTVLMWLSVNPRDQWIRHIYINAVTWINNPQPQLPLTLSILSWDNPCSRLLALQYSPMHLSLSPSDAEKALHLLFFFCCTWFTDPSFGNGESDRSGGGREGGSTHRNKERGGSAK